SSVYSCAISLSFFSLFFFSSRRRHTRSKRDWSSDVCSSDLLGDAGLLPLLQKSGIPEGRGYGGFPVSGIFLRTSNPDLVSRHQRSEERRVGTECRIRCATDPVIIKEWDRRLADIWLSTSSHQ